MNPLFTQRLRALACVAAVAWMVTACGEPPASAPAPSGAASASVTGDNLVGNDKDEHGCIGSAGYRWCDASQACERPWELSRTHGFELSEENVARFCRGEAPES